MVCRTKYWHIIDDLVQQIAIQRNNEDPDPNASLLKIPVQKIMNAHIETEKQRDLEEKLKSQSEIADKALQELDAAKQQGAKELAEKQLTIDKLESELNQTRNTIKQLEHDLQNRGSGMFFFSLFDETC